MTCKLVAITKTPLNAPPLLRKAAGRIYTDCSPSIESLRVRFLEENEEAIAQEEGSNLNVQKHEYARFLMFRGKSAKSTGIMISWTPFFLKQSPAQPISASSPLLIVALWRRIRSIGLWSITIIRQSRNALKSKYKSTGRCRVLRKMFCLEHDHDECPKGTTSGRSLEVNYCSIDDLFLRALILGSLALSSSNSSPIADLFSVPCCALRT